LADLADLRDALVQVLDGVDEVSLAAQDYVFAAKTGDDKATAYRRLTASIAGQYTAANKLRVRLPENHPVMDALGTLRLAVMDEWSAGEDDDAEELTKARVAAEAPHKAFCTAAQRYAGTAFPRDAHNERAEGPSSPPE
jgi:hypothetical protein